MNISNQRLRGTKYGIWLVSEDKLVFGPMMEMIASMDELFSVITPPNNRPIIYWG